MSNGLDRRAFLTATSSAGALTLAFFGVPPRQTRGDDVASAPTNGFPQQNPALVREIVGASHFNEERVRELLAERPELAKSAWDWGFGDWESALGAASHTGRRAIAEALIAHGARPNLFTHAMLGHVDVVRAIVAAQPGVQRIPGPHGITLMAHARAGGAEAEAVVSYLAELGDADLQPKNDPLTDAERAAILGVYSFGAMNGAPGDLRFEIVERRGAIGLVPGDQPFRGLLHQGDFVFNPVGAPSVRVIFEREGERVSGAILAVASERVRATRVDA